MRFGWKELPAIDWEFGWLVGGCACDCERLFGVKGLHWSLVGGRMGSGRCGRERWCGGQVPRPGSLCGCALFRGRDICSRCRHWVRGGVVAKRLVPGGVRAWQCFGGTRVARSVGGTAGSRVEGKVGVAIEASGFVVVLLSDYWLRELVDGRPLTPWVGVLGGSAVWSELVKQ